MKAIILAAGRGTRLGKYTKDLPKGMLNVFGKPIIEQQVELYLKMGIDDISIIKGYCSEKINIKGVKSYYNPVYDKTNMVESLFCAKQELVGEIIISYADILVEPRVLKAVIESKADVGVLVDIDWKNYWMMRYGKVDFDTESLKFNDSGKITELGQGNPVLSDIDGRYVGMIRLSENGAKIVNNIYSEAEQLYRGKPWLNGRNFENIFMTDFLQEIINKGYEVQTIKTKMGWLEFDTNEDYEIITKLYLNKQLSGIFIPSVTG